MAVNMIPETEALQLKYMTPCMERLNASGWPAGMAFSCFGVKIGVRVNRPELLEQIAEYLPPKSGPYPGSTVDCLYSLAVHDNTPDQRIKRFNMLHADTLCVARTFDEQAVFERLGSMLNLTVATAARRHVFVHAGVVSWQGRAIILPGRSFSGKTSLVEALVKAGATYYSDEYAVLDGAGRVHPFARPLSIRARSGQPGGRVPVEKIGGKSGRHSVPVGLVVATSFQDKAGWTPRVLNPSETVMAMVDNAVAVQIRPRKVLNVLKKVATSSVGLSGARGEADDVAEKILEFADSSVPT